MPRRMATGADDAGRRVGTWREWWVLETWRQQEGGRWVDYATQPVVVEDEHEAFVAAVDGLLELAHKDEDSDIRVCGRDLTRTGDGKLIVNRTEDLLRLDVAALTECEPGWRTMGTVALVALLERSERFRYDKVPPPRRQTAAQRAGNVRLITQMKALAATMQRRRWVDIAAPITPTEYVEATAAGYAAFGDPGPPPGSVPVGPPDEPLDF